MKNVTHRLSAKLSVCLLSCGLASLAAADTLLSPVGLWKSFDDVTGLADAEVKIIDINSQLTGTIVHDLITSPTDKPLVCEKCTDDRKGKPVVGMEIIRYARYNAEQDSWDGGHILDPDEGKIYRLRIKVLERGKKLQVRGYSGLFYRTQIWERLPYPSWGF